MFREKKARRTLVKIYNRIIQNKEKMQTNQYSKEGAVFEHREEELDHGLQREDLSDEPQNKSKSDRGKRDKRRSAAPRTKTCANFQCDTTITSNKPYCEPCMEILPKCNNYRCSKKTHHPFSVCLGCHLRRRSQARLPSTKCRTANCKFARAVEGFCETCFETAEKLQCINPTCANITSRQNRVCELCFTQRLFACEQCSTAISQPNMCVPCLRANHRALKNLAAV